MLTKQQTFIHFQHSYLNSSILTGTLIRSPNLYFPARRIIGSFNFLAKFRKSKHEDNAPSLVTEVSVDNKSVPTDNEIKFEDKIFQNNLDMNKSVFEPKKSPVSEKVNKPYNLNKNITDVLEGYYFFFFQNKQDY